MDHQNETSLTVRDEELSAVSAGRFKRQGKIPGYTPPTVIYDDGINIQTTDPSTTNVGYDSPWTPIFPL